MSLPNLRSRHKPPSKTSDYLVDSASSSSSSSDEGNGDVQVPTHSHTAPVRISVLDVLRVLAGLFLLSSTLSYFVTRNSIFWGHRPAFTRPARVQAWLRGPLLLTPSELSLYNGTDPTLPIYIALNGSIYDVSASPHLYGPGGSYHFFAGRDATRAFVTGCFEEDLTGDLRGVEEMYVPLEFDTLPEGLAGRERGAWKVRRERVWREAREKVRGVVEGWEKTFDGGKGGKYFWVGRVKGGEVVGERRRLCERARGLRPERGEDGG